MSRESREIRNFHAHLYYDADTLEEARALRERAGNEFGVELGRLHERPVGPHPMWSCQLTVTREQFGTVIPWLAVNRGNLDVFVHVRTGDDWFDHTAGVMWLGRSHDLNLDALRS